MRRFRTYHEVDPEAGEELLDQVRAQRERLRERLDAVGAVVAVASGKGGVGKSALTANLAAALASRGRRVGALDGDLNGPSLARMLGASGGRLGDAEEGIVPPEGVEGIRVVSMELLQEEEDAPLSWREPSGDGFIWQSSLETGALREFLSDVAWGELDLLLVDVPPGTDKIRRLLDLVPDLDLALLVTTPSEAARSVVARSVSLVRGREVSGVALVANMTEHVCPECGHHSNLFPGDGAERLAADTGVALWARIPFDPRLARATDRGRPLVLEEPDAEAARALLALADRVEAAATGEAP